MTTSSLSTAPDTTPSPPPESRRRTRRRSPRRGGERWRAAGGTLAGLALAALVWTLIVATGHFPAQLFPSVPKIAAAGHTLWSDGLLIPDITASLRRALLGFAAGSAAGVAAAILTSSTAAGRRLLQPVLRLLSPVPTIGLVPLAILWFGLGENSKTLVIALGVFVPVWINSHAGFASTPADFLRAARCLGAGRAQTLARVVVPEALPDVAAGLRVGAAMAFVLIVVAEMTGTTAGIGYRIYQAQLFSQADRLIFCLIVLGIIGAACDLAIATITAPITRWAREER
ncbi:NitT/TauT family transport system permease protein/sulfonate transport system permease protein [Nocardia transvalensis]|uniref:NitT/TauT family transport system permease protein/sulfonate transport system permease protein n=1 Tax=Nocardia transvalensis TaxID=37333 RepID=A0A7W9UM26_9NOCA|nr:ABC transporter permease [Nocardia transvalensis]MBB5918196.1 NitT/TauT family transport system permease protein/sulfonate transport system permease protein [Nocardia transvalensis]